MVVLLSPPGRAATRLAEASRLTRTEMSCILDGVCSEWQEGAVSEREGCSGREIFAAGAHRVFVCTGDPGSLDSTHIEAPLAVRLTKPLLQPLRWAITVSMKLTRCSVLIWMSLDLNRHASDGQLILCPASWVSRAAARHLADTAMCLWGISRM